jgi:hypothetical protein
MVTLRSPDAGEVDAFQEHHLEAFHRVLASGVKALKVDAVLSESLVELTTMPTNCRISQPGREPITDVGSVEAVEGVVRDGEPGWFHVDEISTDPLPSGHTSRRWGTATKRPDGAVTLDPDPWPDR